MQQKIEQAVDVVAIFSAQPKQIKPYKLRWQGREYLVKKVGYHHQVWLGRHLHHIFSLTDGSIFFRLNFASEDLVWTLEEISDGMVD
jgi:hypothetical protein